MSDYDIHSCGYYCDRHACIVAQRNELRDKLFSEQAVKTYSGGKPNYTQPKDEPVIDKSMAKRIATQLGWEPKREWVGLTDMEIDAAVKSCNTTDTYKYFRAIEAKLKEKNT